MHDHKDKKPQKKEHMSLRVMLTSKTSQSLWNFLFYFLSLLHSIIYTEKVIITNFPTQETPATSYYRLRTAISQLGGGL
jgi:hypothetical protein